MSVLEDFNQWQDENYLMATMIGSGILWAIGDALAQLTERPRQPFSPIRLVRHSSFGTFVFAPLAYFWYPGLDTVFPETTFWTVVAKVALDQFVWSPPILSLIFCWTVLWQGKDMMDAWNLIKSDLWKTLKVNWIVWPSIQAINMSIMPVHYRIVFVNLVNIPWTGFLSLISNGKKKNASAKPLPSEEEGVAPQIV